MSALMQQHVFGAGADIIDLGEQLRGRLLTGNEMKLSVQAIKLFSQQQSIQISEEPAIERKGNTWFCHRCHNQQVHLFQKNICICQGDCVYCLQCLPFGKLRSCDRLYHLPAAKQYGWQREITYCHWTGKLSVQQQEAANEICDAFRQHNTRLVWAVTGAGKTEMIFPVIDQALMAGLRVVIATPRIDVANELLPRLQTAFPEIDLLLLHSQSEDRYRLTPIVLCSTHQLIRFQNAFDLVIIDEIDAFPFMDDQMLYMAAKRAAKAPSCMILLTATPSKDMQKQIAQQQLNASILPARYHRQPLPVPKHIWVGNWRAQIRKQQIPPVLIKYINRLLSAKRRFLLFLPNIQLMRQCEQNLRCHFPQFQFTSVSAKDAQRIEKVQKMRETAYDFLLTTTILERGVTFPAIDVIILGSEDRIYTLASLIQISGRVGRKMHAPDGEVYFLHYGKTQASVGAVRQIKHMNALARHRSLLDE